MFMSLAAIGLAVMCNGCATMHPSATAPAVDKQVVEAQPQPPKAPQQELANKNDPIGESVYIMGGLAQLGSFLAIGK